MTDYKALAERMRADWRKPENKPPELNEGANAIEALIAEVERLKADSEVLKSVLSAYGIRTSALESELAELKAQEPVAWAFFFEDGDISNEFFSNEKEGLEWMNKDDCMWAGYIAPLYTKPAPRDEQVEQLTKERDAYLKRLNDEFGCESCPGLPDLARSEDVAEAALKAVFFDVPEIANKPTTFEQLTTEREKVRILREALNTTNKWFVARLNGQAVCGSTSMMIDVTGKALAQTGEK